MNNASGLLLANLIRRRDDEKFTRSDEKSYSPQKIELCSFRQTLESLKWVGQEYSAPLRI